MIEVIQNFFLTKPQPVIKIFFPFRHIFGFLVCFSFFESVRLFYKMILTQRGEEETDNTACNPKVTFEQGEKTFI